MGAPDLLAHLQAAGLVLTLTPDAKLHVAPMSRITEAYRAAIRAHRDALVAALRDDAPKPKPRSGNPLMSVDDWNEAHLGGWDDAEIATYLDWQRHYDALGRPDAQHRAELEILSARRALKWGLS